MKKGYKGMTKDMTCLGMSFEIGKAYHVNGKIKLCKNGLHFCEKLYDVFKYYNKFKSRFFEVIADGKIVTDGIKSAASDIVVVREVTGKEFYRVLYGDGYGYNYGYGHSHNYGYGYGYGDNYGYGYGYGDGYGYCYSDGNGDGYGDGNVYGYGYGDSYGHTKNLQKVLLFNV